ncbi:MAG TPA: sigma-70 family RNA polymerase sigma factor [Blastocatellia bacterium]|nr:sigma-70 family RNA polymerase sigma factor [Blastocatellia bacterium]
MAKLSADPEIAGVEYEELRRRLIKFFEWRGAFFPEDLADETLNRTARKIDEGEEIEKNVIALALGVAHFVFLETSRRPDNRRAQMEELIPVAAPPEHQVEDDDLRVVYLRECLRGLSTESRELIIEYYGEEGRAKIEDRKALAEKLGISLNALFSRAKRIRDRLEQCVTRRLKTKLGGSSMQRPPAREARRPGGDQQ